MVLRRPTLWWVATLYCCCILLFVVPGTDAYFTKDEVSHISAKIGEDLSVLKGENNRITRHLEFANDRGSHMLFQQKGTMRNGIVRVPDVINVTCLPANNKNDESGAVYYKAVFTADNAADMQDFTDSVAAADAANSAGNRTVVVGHCTPTLGHPSSDADGADPDGQLSGAKNQTFVASLDSYVTVGATAAVAEIEMQDVFSLFTDFSMRLFVGNTSYGTAVNMHANVSKEEKEHLLKPFFTEDEQRNSKQPRTIECTASKSSTQRQQQSPQQSQ